MRKETVHYKRSSRAGRKALALLLSCLMAFAALPAPALAAEDGGASAAQNTTSFGESLEDNTLSGTPEIGGLPGETDGEPIDAPAPTVEGDCIFANGLALTIAEGERPGTSAVTYGEENTPFLIDGEASLDLSGFTVYGGGNDTPVDGDTAITMIGGTVKSIYGGGSGDNGTVGGEISVTVGGVAKIGAASPESGVYLNGTGVTNGVDALTYGPALTDGAAVYVVLPADADRAAFSVDSAYVHLSGEPPVTNEIRPYSDNALPGNESLPNITDFSANSSDVTEYAVNSVEGLQKLADLVNGGNDLSGYTITMTDNIDCNNEAMTPIGGKKSTDESDVPAPAFSGTFDGSNFNITNLSITDSGNQDCGTGLFGYVSNGTVKNLTVTGAITGSSYVGVIAGVVEYGTLHKCNAKGTVNGSYYIGGGVGSATGGTIEDCNSEVTVTGVNSVGGIVGYAEGYEESYDEGVDPIITISGCNFNGSINNPDEAEPASGYSSNIYYVGGIVGNANYCAMTDCISNGTVAGVSSIGGIVGSANSSTITSCRFGDEIAPQSSASATVTSSGSYSAGAGGIAGATTRSTISDCTSNGTITGGEYNAGGIVGGAMDSVVNGCKSAGTVTGEDTVGGIVGYCVRTPSSPDPVSLTNESLAPGTVANCESSCTVSGMSAVGGIVGHAQIGSGVNSLSSNGAPTEETAAGPVITGCTFTGTVGIGTYPEYSYSIQYFGGIAGLAENSTVSGCESTDAVIGSSYVSGIVGRAENSAISGCKSTGAVTGSSYVGGIVGYSIFYDMSINSLNNDLTAPVPGTVTNCESGCTVTGYKGVGGIAGQFVCEGDGNYPELTISGCTFKGKVIADASKQPAPASEYAYSSTPENFGGIVGCIGVGAVENCKNEGKVSCIATDEDGNKSGAQFVGGIAGQAVSCMVTGCTNSGAVSGVQPVGGIVGENADGSSYSLSQNYTPATVQNCVNTGNVTGGYCAGGVVGANAYGTVKSCFSTGTVQWAVGFEGKIFGGVVGGNAGTVTDCYATGNVVGVSDDGQYATNYVGGIVGSNDGAMDHCYATGDVFGLDYVGGIAGGPSMSSNGDTPTIQNCAALGLTVTAVYEAVQNFGRVCGNGGSLADNMARGDMLVNENTVTENVGGNAINGATVTVGTSTYGTVFSETWRGDAWTYPDGISDASILKNRGLLPTLMGISADQIEQKPYLPGTAPVATITKNGETTEYSTLAEALGGASAGDTIQVIADIELDTSVDFSMALTLDLNGFIISGAALSVTEAGNLTVTDSSVEKTGKIDGGSEKPAIECAGTLTVSGGTLTCKATSKGTIEMTAATHLTINEGVKVENTAENGYAVYFSNPSVTVDNLSEYFTRVDGATVGRVYPHPMPTVENPGGKYELYANGTDLKLAAGTSDPTKTKIFYREMGSEGEYLPYTIPSDTGVGDSLSEGYDLSGYAVYGGRNGKALTGNTKITMEGGKVQSVYGGGNKSSVTGSTEITIGTGATVTSSVYGGSYGDSAKDSNITGTATVTISGTVGNSSSTGTVYGGGNNGGAVGGTKVTIATGGKVTGSVYGGGRGDVNGSTEVTVYGEVTGTVYGGGCGEAGTVTGNTTVSIAKDSKTGSVYGGGGTSGSGGGAVNGNTTVTFGGSVTGSVYGGGFKGTVGGNTTVTITKDGSLTVGAYNSGGDVYGGGNGGTVTGNTNVTINGQVGKNVYGGGYDSTVGVSDDSTKGNTVVTIEEGGKVGSTATSSGNVYGGGSGAGSAVTGNTAVTVNGSGTGTSATDFAAVNVYGGGFINAAGTTTVEGKATVVINGKIKTSVYGGGCQGSSANVTASAVTGSTEVTIADGGSVADSVYGGGSGAGSTVTGDTTVTVANGGSVSGSATNTGNVYGGGFINATSGENKVNGKTTVVINGTVKSNVYGGGNQDGKAGSTASADTGDTEVTVACGNTSLYVYGGGYSTYGTSSSGSAKVTIANGGNVNTVNGGGIGAGSTVSSTDVTIADSGKVNSYVYGGSSSGTVTGSTKVTIASGGAVSGNVFGGSYSTTGTVGGNTEVIVSGTVSGTYGGNVYGGGLNSNVTGNTAVTVSGTVSQSVYGGGSISNGASSGTVSVVGGDTSVTIASGGTVTQNVYGGGNNKGTVTGKATVSVSGTVTQDVYGGGTIDSTVTGDTSVTVGGTAKIGGSTDKGIIINNGTDVTNGVASFQIQSDQPLTADASVYVVLPSGFAPGGTIATGAKDGDQGYIHLVGSNTWHLVPTYDGTGEVKAIKASYPAPITLKSTTTATELSQLLGSDVTVSGEKGALTLQLTNNKTLITTIRVESGAHTLDLNGKTLTIPVFGELAGGGAGANGCIEVSGGKLTVTDGSTGKIEPGTGTPAANFGVLTVSGGEAELSGGSIENTKTNGSWAVRATEDGVFKMTGGALSGDSTNGQALYVAGEKNAKLSGGTIDGGGDDKTAITVGTGAVGKLLAEGCYYYKVTLASPNGKKVTDVSGDTLSGKYIVDNRTVAQYTTDGGTTWADCDSLSEAISGAQSDSFAEANQVRLTQDVKTSIAIGFGGFTLDLQGHTWTCAAGYAPLKLGGSVPVAITDSKGGGKLTGPDAATISEESKAAQPAISVATGAALTLTGEKAFTVQGGKGLDSATDEKLLAGAPGVSVDGGKLEVSGTDQILVQGGDGGSADSGGPGGAGVSASGSDLSVTGGSFTGGAGGNSSGTMSYTDAGFGGGPGEPLPKIGGFGGDGISMTGGTLTVSNGAFTGGAGGKSTVSGAGNSSDGGAGDGLYLNTVIATVDGGVFDGQIAIFATGGSNAVGAGGTTHPLVVNDGVFTGESYGLSVSVVPVTVNGGTFTGGNGAVVIADRAGALAGGTFTGGGANAYAILSGTPSNAPKVSALLDEGKAYYDADGVQITEGLDASTLGKNATIRVLNAPSAPDTYSISGVVKMHDGSTSAVGAKVTLKQGAETVAVTWTDSQGGYVFGGVPTGLYNVVAEHSDLTMTILVALTKNDENEQDITLPEAGKNSVVEVKENTPPVVVGGVEEVAESQTDSSGSITVKLTVEQKDNPAGKTEIEGEAKGQTLLYLDVSLMLHKGSGAPEDLGPSNNKVLELVLPYNFRGKKDVTVYRYHDDGAGAQAAELTALEGAPVTKTDGTFWADTENGYLHIYASKFSTYAVGYTRISTGGSSESHTLTASAGDGGSISPSGAVSVPQGGSQTFSVTPHSGYALRDVLVDGRSVGAVTSYTFENVTEDHSISAVFKPSWNPFTDVTESDWFYGAVRHAYEQNWMLGTSNTTFSPELSTQRGMIVTILWRMEGQPEAAGVRDFTDVEEGRYYTEAVAWADKNGIAMGYGNNKFGPSDPVTREQLAAILYRYAQYKGMDVSAKGELSGFTDAGKASAYAREPLGWAVGQGILNGKGGGILDPRGQATRAETAAMLQRFAAMAVQ